MYVSQGGNVHVGGKGGMCDSRPAPAGLSPSSHGTVKLEVIPQVRAASRLLPTQATPLRSPGADAPRGCGTAND
jgi:hypothetical protein